jgi:hypothetical protein
LGRRRAGLLRRVDGVSGQALATCSSLLTGCGQPDMAAAGCWPAGGHPWPTLAGCGWLVGAAAVREVAAAARRGSGNMAKVQQGYGFPARYIARHEGRFRQARLKM